MPSTHAAKNNTPKMMAATEPPSRPSCDSLLVTTGLLNGVGGNVGCANVANGVGGGGAQVADSQARSATLSSGEQGVPPFCCCIITVLMRRSEEHTSELQSLE